MLNLAEIAAAHSAPAFKLSRRRNCSSPMHSQVIGMTSFSPSQYVANNVMGEHQYSTSKVRGATTTNRRNTPSSAASKISHVSA